MAIQNGTAGVDYLYGTESADRIYGHGGGDELVGHSRTDHLFGGADEDDLFGGRGLDQLWGGGGNDFVAGEGGNDVVRGEGGNDWVWGGEGRDVLVGGVGSDTFQFMVDGDGNDLAADFVKGVDRIRIIAAHDGETGGAPTFGDLDSNDNGVLDAADAEVRVESASHGSASRTSTVIELWSGDLTVFGATGLTSADFY